MALKLSFIVPVYNVAPYLRKCVDSLLAQDYNNYEIILVDDGSPDDCPQICDEYAEKANASQELRAKSVPIRVIHQQNGGLSAARNAGLEVAQGEYVCFVDSDDYWEPNVLGGLMAQVEHDNLDVLRFEYQNVNEHYQVYLPNKYPHQVDSHVEITNGRDYLNERMGYACYAVMYIMRRSIVPKFAEGIHFEDVDWLPRMMLQARHVRSSTKVVYNYLIRQGSITQVQGNKDKIRKNLADRMRLIESYSTYREQYPDCSWLGKMQGMLVTDAITIVAREFYSERNDYIRQLKRLHVFPLIIANQGETYARRAKLINLLGVNAYCMLMHLRA